MRSLFWLGSHSKLKVETTLFQSSGSQTRPVSPIVLYYLGRPISAVPRVPSSWDAPAPSLPRAGRGGGDEPPVEHQDKVKCSSLSISQHVQ